MKALGALAWAVGGLSLLGAAYAFLPMKEGALPILVGIIPVTAGRCHDSVRMGAYVVLWLVPILALLLYLFLSAGTVC